MDYIAFLQTAAERLTLVIREIPPGHGNITPYLVRAYMAAANLEGFGVSFEKIQRDLEDRVSRIPIKSRIPNP